MIAAGVLCCIVTLSLFWPAFFFISHDWTASFKRSLFTHEGLGLVLTGDLSRVSDRNSSERGIFGAVLHAAPKSCR